MYRNFIIAFLTIFLLAGCGSSVDSPIEQLKKQLKDVPSYSVILDDMKEDGNFFESYFHKYKIMQPENVSNTDWMQVPEDFYLQNEKFLGMSIFDKKDGKENSQASPPGYNFVGDNRYGEWRRDSSGNAFWAFFGGMAFSRVLGQLGDGIERRNYDTYNNYRQQKAPYYGPNNEYGTNGTITKKQKPDFFARRMEKVQQKKTSFADRVMSRMGTSKASTSKIGRSRSSFGSRSGSSGK